MQLNEWMTAQGLTDQQFAETLAVSREYVRLLRHRKRNPSPEAIRLIETATAGQVTAVDLLHMKENV